MFPDEMLDDISNYHNLIYFNEVDNGGHFAAFEEPELFTAELREAFRPLRLTPPERRLPAN